jgi:hypothetical protein
LIGNANEVSADTVEFVNENQARYFRVVRVSPVGLRLGLKTARTAEYADTAVKNFQ